MTLELKLKTVYGPHLSRCFGTSIGVDPLLPPKKCPLNCVYCPIGETGVKSTKPRIYASPSRVLNDLKHYVESNGIDFSAVYVWGSGDPLLNYQLPIIIDNLRDFLRDFSFSGKIVVRTSGVLLGSDWFRPALNYVDEVVVPVSLPRSYWSLYAEPASECKLSSVIDALRSLSATHSDRLSIEFVAFRVADFANVQEEVMSEIVSLFHSVKPSKVYVKTVDRPCSSTSVKPVRGELFKRAVERLVNEGFKATVCSDERLSGISSARTSSDLLNHIARKSLSTDEVLKMYGSRGLLLLEDLLAKNYVDKISWDSKIYFRLRKYPTS